MLGMKPNLAFFKANSFHGCYTISIGPYLLILEEGKGDNLKAGAHTEVPGSGAKVRAQW